MGAGALGEKTTFLAMMEGVTFDFKYPDFG